MKKYSTILFDLDHTLWDFETNSEETLRDLFRRYDLEQRGITSFKYFFETFTRINIDLWNQYDLGHIGQDVIRTQRFHKVLFATGVDDYRMSLQFSADFLAELPQKKNLLPQAKALLDHLHGSYKMIVVTNGFEETQVGKMTSSGIIQYFDAIVTSQRAGHKKPSPEIFEFTLSEAGVDPADAVMVGDNLLTDMAGAKAAGVDCIYYNPLGQPHKEKVTFEIKSLDELRTLL